MSVKLAKKLLIIDDDRFFCKSLTNYLAVQDYEILSAHTLEDGENCFRKQKIDVILLDQKLPDGNGIDLCNAILRKSEQVKIIFITAFPSFDNAVKALRKGAFDYLSKPLEIEEVAMTVNQAFRTLELENVEHIQNYKNRQEHNQHVLIGQEGGLKDTSKYIRLSAENDVPILITGETGTGKNVVAKSIHYSGTSSKGCLMDINCAALPENLIEAELFGYERGAFTGATSAKKGIFELADGGTLFLDEIGELPLHLQAKLLGVLDEHKVKRLGGESYKQIHVKIIAATNVDLEKAVENNLFRQDLFFRLSVLPIHLPPLRDRIEDIAPLCSYFISCSAQKSNAVLPPDEMLKLQEYHWPGNVRELRNVIERSLIFTRNGCIYPSELLTTQNLENTGPEPSSRSSVQSLAEVEKSHIIQVLKELNNNHTHAATALGISRSTLIRKLKHYTISPGVAK